MNSVERDELDGKPSSVEFQMDNMRISVATVVLTLILASARSDKSKSEDLYLIGHDRSQRLVRK